MRAHRFACLAVALLAGCASVGTREGEATTGIALDGLPVADRVSDTTREVLSMLGIEGDCEREAAACARAVLDRPGPVREGTRLLAAADLLHRGAQRGVQPEILALDCVRHTWRYLFAPALPGRKSALDARSQLALRLHDACTAELVQRVPTNATLPIAWRWRTDELRFPREGVQRIVLAARIRTTGLRTRQVDDGIGVAAVAVGESRGAALFPDQPFALAINVRYVREGDAESLDIADASSHGRVDTALGPVDIARDTSAAYALAAGLFENELTAWGGLRQSSDVVSTELRLLEPMNRNKTALLLIHGFASSPMAWANLANELLGDPELADRYMVCLARYPTASAILVNRYELARKITKLRDWHVADGGDPRFVVAGHSMGGVIARLLVTDPGTTLWDAAFTRPPGALGVAPDLDTLTQRYFLFDPMPGIDTVIFIATPHGGSAKADGVIARVVRGLLAAPPKVLSALTKIVHEAPDAVRPELHAVYEAGGPTSIDTLSPMQPVIRAARSLPVVDGVEVYSLIGIVDPDHPERGDGVVPLESAQWPGAHEMLIRGDHSLQESPEAIAALKQILLERLERAPPRTGPRE